MVLHQPGKPLRYEEVERPEPGKDLVLIKVHACGVCRTDQHIVDGELSDPKLPLIPGHEIIGEIVENGEGSGRFSIGQRVGVPWLGHTCGHCYYCKNGHENLCENAKFTGYTINGGYAEYTVAEERYCFPIPEQYEDTHAAPLMCAGLIGFRSYSMVGDAKRIGFYGFGASAHILIQIARNDGREVYAFTRSGDKTGQDFARNLGAVWAGGSNEKPPEELDAAILFAPVGALVPAALKTVRKAGIVVCAGIHMSDIPSFPYKILWEERQIKSVANLTRADGEGFVKAASKTKIDTEVHPYKLEDANRALQDLREGNFNGAAVLTMNS
ncbi:MAG TPA: zinc-dependent alcohol dehydrogenase family protein [Balneolales bacterium]|nr:zinc-dependent alcohol dehydrogenase family protein [Balneolales bacterium]